MKDFCDKILDIKARYLEKGIRSPLALIVHPNIVAYLIKDIRFLDPARYGKRTNVYNKEIGMICGVKILVDPKIDEDKAIVICLSTYYAKEKEIALLDFNPSRRFQKNIELNF